MNEHFDHPTDHTLQSNDAASVTSAPSTQQQKKAPSFFGELIKFALIAIVIVLPIRLFIAQPFIVSGSSMDPTFANGEYLIVDEISYRFNDPERGEVVIFRFPRDTSKFFIKRIIGLPGETVEIAGSAITIFNDEFPEGFILSEPYITHPASDSLRVTLNDEQYFVLGDNRIASSDSRTWGALDEEFLIGKAFLRLLPVTNIGVLPGEHTDS